MSLTENIVGSVLIILLSSCALAPFICAGVHIYQRCAGNKPAPQTIAMQYEKLIEHEYSIDETKQEARSQSQEYTRDTVLTRDQILEMLPKEDRECMVKRINSKCGGALVTIYANTNHDRFRVRLIKATITHPNGVVTLLTEAGEELLMK